MWRHLREKRPQEARAVVERAVQSVQEHPATEPISRVEKPCAAVQDERCQRTLNHRGMLVWRTLETVMGQERVDRSLGDLSVRFVKRGASLDDFRKICEEISGRKLGWFFDYYIHGVQLPEITLRRIPGSAPNEVAGEILVKNTPREFQVRVEMRLHTSAGVIHHSVATNGPVTPFTVTTNEMVTRIALDPDLRILRKLPVQP